MLDASLMKLMDILSGHGIEVNVIESDADIKDDGFYFFARSEHDIGIEHWSKAAAHKMKVANDHGLYCDGFISLIDCEDIDVFCNRMIVWNNAVKNSHL